MNDHNLTAQHERRGAIRPRPSRELYHSKWTAHYSCLNYDKGLQKFVMNRGHQMLEDHKFDAGVSKVLEVGSGTGEHLPYVKHPFTSYNCSDLSLGMISQNRMHQDPRVIYTCEDATQIKLPDHSVDRLIACHVLEHLPDPEAALMEWVRVVRNGGVISILLPCDPGLLWRFGRTLGPRKNFEKLGLPYDYWMAKEHVNPIGNLLALIRYYFVNIEEMWWPTRIPLYDLNLFYGCHIFT